MPGRRRVVFKLSSMSTNAAVLDNIRTTLQGALSAFSVGAFPAAHFKSNRLVFANEVDGALVLVNPRYQLETWEAPGGSGEAAEVAHEPHAVGDGSVFLLCHVLPDGSWKPYVPSSTVRYAKDATITITRMCLLFPFLSFLLSVRPFLLTVGSSSVPGLGARFVFEAEDQEEPVDWTVLPL